MCWLVFGFVATGSHKQFLPWMNKSLCSRTNTSIRGEMKVKHIKRFDQDMFIIKLNDQFDHVPLAILTGYNTLSTES